MAFPAPSPAPSGGGRPVRLSYENVARILYGRLDQGFSGIQRRFMRDLFQLQNEQAGRTVLNQLIAAAGGAQTMPAPGSPQWNALVGELQTMAAAHQVLFNEQAQAVIRSAAEAAGQAVPAVAALAAGRGNSLSAQWNRVDPLAVEAAMTTMHRPAFEQAVRNYGDQYVKAAQSILITGLAAGQNSRTTARLLRQLITDMPAQSAATMTRTLQMNSYRSATAMHQRANSRVLGKQIRVAALDARCCVACLALHGREYPVGEEIVDHANGRCIGIGIPRGSEVTVESGPEWLDGQPEAVQQQIMGRANWNAWKAGAVRLDQFVGYRNDPVWGPQTVQRSLKGILGPAGANRFYSHPRQWGGGGPAGAPRTPIVRARPAEQRVLARQRWESYRKNGTAQNSGVEAAVAFTNGEYRRMRLAQRFTWEELGAMGLQGDFSGKRSYTTYRNKAERADLVLNDPTLPVYEGRIQRKIDITPPRPMNDVELAQFLQSAPDQLQRGAPVTVGEAFSEGTLSSYSREQHVWSGNVVLHIQNNRTGVSVESISQHSSELEILMPAGAVFRVESITPASQLPASHPMQGHVTKGYHVVIELSEYDFEEDLAAALAARQLAPRGTP
jgi:hypothetical protein